MSFERGDIVLLPFPFTDLTTTKQRPAVVLSHGNFNQTHPDVIVAAITSRVPAEPALEDVVLTHPEAHAAHLLKPSVIKVAKIVTIDQRLIRKSLGHLPAAVQRKIQTKLRKLLLR